MAAEQIANPAPASADNGQAVLLGQNNTATLNTGVSSSVVNDQAFTAFASGASSTALQGNSTSGVGVVGTSGGGSGVYGQSGNTNGFAITLDGVRGFTDASTASGLRGENPSGGDGVSGSSPKGAGVHGISNEAFGVLGEVDGGLGTAVYGNATGGANGVEGFSQTGIGVIGTAANGTGVYGRTGKTIGLFSTHDGVHGFTDIGTSSGVHGEHAVAGDGVTGSSPKGAGVHGVSGDAWGVFGEVTAGLGTGVYGQATGRANGVEGFSQHGAGVIGTATSGIGVAAVAQAAGIALSVSGKAKFARSGQVHISGTAKEAKATVTDGLAADSLVLAVVQSDSPGIWVTAAIPDSATGKVTIRLNKAPGTKGRPVAVAYFVLN